MKKTINRSFRTTTILVLFLCSALSGAFAQSTSWTGNSNTKWGNSSNWTNGVPTSTTDAIIGDANFTGSNQPRMKRGSTPKCKSLTIGTGAIACTLRVEKNCLVYGDITIGANGTINHTAGRTIRLTGDWTNNGTYSATNNGAEVSFSGTSCTLSGATTFKDLYITSGTTLTLASNITVNSDLDCYGVLNPTASYTVGGTADLDVERDGSIQVHTATFAGNYTISQVDIDDRGEVNYASSSITQTVSSVYTYGILRISGGSTKELAADLPDLHNGGSTRGRIFIDAGIFDIKQYTCDRQSSGGAFVIAADAELHIGGTNGFPNNFDTKSLASSSTVYYYGNNQTVEDIDYGHLILSGTSGTVTKTMPATTLDILGEFIIEQGTASTVSATAGAAINVEQNVYIESGCTLGGGSYTHTFNADFDNEGTFSGATSTVKFSGVGAVLSGSGSHDFNHLTFEVSGITATSDVTLNVSGNLTTTGAGTFTHDAGGLVDLTGSSKSIVGSNFIFADLDISGTITTAEHIDVVGDFTVDGTFTATASVVHLTGSSSTIAGAGSLRFYGLDITGSTTTARDFVVENDMSISTTGSFVASAGDITFDGNSNLSGTAEVYDISINSGKTLQLGANAQLDIANTFVNSGTFNTNSLIPNTVRYVKNGAQTIAAETYYNLILASGGTKTLGGNTTVNNDITINSGVTLDGATHTLSIYRHWNNDGSFTASSSDVQFRGSNAASLTGATTFNTFTVNKSSSDVQVYLNNDMVATDITITQGYVETGVNSITTTSTRTGNGIILGTIVHDHTISNGVTYYFEGPNNGLTFYNPSSLSQVTVNVTVGEVANVNPVEESVTRSYDISIPSGTYDSATLRAHYEDQELNAFVEPYLALYSYNSGTTWDSLGFYSRSTTDNWVELGGITDINNVFMLAGLRNEVRWTGTVSSDWSNAANWTTVSGASMANRVPDSLDVARIGDTLFVNQPVISTTEKINVLRFADTKAATITFSGGSLDVVGSARGNWSSNVSHTLDINDDDLSIGTNLTLSDGVNGHDIELIIKDGSASVGYDLVQSGSGQVTFTGTGDLTVIHDYDYTSGTFTAGTGTVIYGGGINQDIADLAYYNLTIDKSTARASIISATSVSNNFSTSTGGETALLAALDVDGNFSIGASTQVFEFNTLITVGGNWSNNGLFTVTGGTVEFDGSNKQTVDGTTFNNLTVNKSADTLLLTDDLIINNNLSLNNGTLDIVTYAVDRSSLGGELTLDSASVLIIRGADNFPHYFLTTNIDTHSTVSYAGFVNQEVLAVTYGNLEFYNGSPNEKTLSQDITVLNDLSNNTLSIFSPDTASVFLYGNFANSSTINPGSSSLILNGSGKTITGSSNLNNVTVNGDYTVISGTTSMAGDLFIETTGSLNFGANTAILDGDLTNSGSLTSMGIATFTGTQVQNISLLNSITSSSTGVINFNGTVAPVISSTSSPSFATVNINNTAGITPSVPWNVFVALNVDANASFNAGALTHTIYGNMTNDGSIYSTGKLIFSPVSSAVSIQLDGDTFQSTGEVAFAGSMAITLSGSNPAFEKVVISNSHSSGVTAPASWAISGDLQINNGAVFHAGTSNAHTIGENLVNNGTLDGGSSLITFVGDTVGIEGIGTNNFEDIQVDAASFLTLENDIYVFSDFINDGEFNSGGYTVDFTGSAAGTISGSTGAVDIYRLASSKSTGVATTLSIPVTVLDELSLTSGLFVTDATNLIIVENDATSDSGSDTCYVDGPMKKVGDDAFEFPLGDNGVWARLAISAPTDTADEFTAEYFYSNYTDTSTMAASPTPVLNNVSSVEYWTCDRTVGSSNVTVELFWENKNRSGIESYSSDLVVAHWNGSAWENAGQSTINASFMGSVTSNTVSSFSPFTFGSTSAASNPLPVELLNFTATLNHNQYVDLKWETASELNNDYFTVERSADGEHFEPILVMSGAGTSNEINTYLANDMAPLTGINFYRLKQTDFDGTSSYSAIQSVMLEQHTEIVYYPNPTSGLLHIHASSKTDASVQVLDAFGRLLMADTFKGTDFSVDLSELKAGIYYVHLTENGQTRTQRIFKS